MTMPCIWNNLQWFDYLLYLYIIDDFTMDNNECLMNINKWIRFRSEYFFLRMEFGSFIYIYIYIENFKYTCTCIAWSSVAALSIPPLLVSMSKRELTALFTDTKEIIIFHCGSPDHYCVKNIRSVLLILFPVHLFYA